LVPDPLVPVRWRKELVPDPLVPVKWRKEMEEGIGSSEMEEGIGTGSIGSSEWRKEEGSIGTDGGVMVRWWCDPLVPDPLVPVPFVV
jgi:hypothetical protein